jgi:hypothetical protein
MANQTPKELPSWNGKAIANQADIHDLEADAAVHEFKHRMSKDDAESAAYHKYKQRQHKIAAAHHFAGLKAAQGAGSHEEAQKHGLLYAEHLRAVGEDPLGAVPADIKAMAGENERFYKFKPSKADALLFGRGTEAKADDKGEGKA